jgi:hypothetical protein
VDSQLIDRNGFGLLDLLEAALRYLDLRIVGLRATWHDENLARDQDEPPDESISERVDRIRNSPAVVSREAVEDYVSYESDQRPWLAECRNPERAAMAWEWATRDIARSKFTLGIDVNEFGSALSFQRGETTTPVPASHVLGGLFSAAGELGSQIADTGPWDIILRKGAAVSTATALGVDLANAPDDDDGRIDWLASADVMAYAPSRRRSVVVGFAGGLTYQQLRESIDTATSRVSEWAANESQEAPVRDSDAIVSQMIVYGGPIRIAPRFGNGPLVVHCEELADMLSEATNTEFDDDVHGVLWWQFVEEMWTLPGVREIMALGLDEVWHHWMRHGVLNLGGQPDVGLFVATEADDHRWAFDAKWEPFDDVLHQAGLPPHMLWSVARLQENDEEAVIGDRHSRWTVSTTPPIVIGAVLTEEPPPPPIDQGAAYGIADGILMTIKHNEYLERTIAVNGGRTPLIEIRLGPTDTELGSEVAGISVERPDGTSHVFRITLEPAWMKLLTLAAQDAHDALGDVLIGWLGEMAHSPTDVDALRAAWRQMPPVMLIHPVFDSLRLRREGHITLPRNVVSRGKARHRLSCEILANCACPNLCTGDDAIHQAVDELVPITSRVIEGMLADWSPDALTIIAGHLNDAYAEHYRMGIELDHVLSAPWADGWRAEALLAPDPSEKTRSLEVLFETALTVDFNGKIVPDQFDIAEAVELAELLFQIGASASGAMKGMHDLVVMISSGGIMQTRAASSKEAGAFSRGVRPKQLELDVVAYQEALRLHAMNARERYEPEEVTDWLEATGSESRGADSFRLLASTGFPPSLLRADRVLLDAVGTGLDGLTAVLGTALDLRGGDDRVSIVPKNELVAEAREWSGLPTTIVEAAIKLLTLSGPLLKSEVTPFWEQEARRYRLTTSPIVGLAADNLLILPWRIRASQEVFRMYLADGSIPWQRSHLPAQVDDAFKRYRSVMNRALEREAELVAKSLGLPCQRNVTVDQATKGGLTIGGEVDLLVGDPGRGRIWVCEVKDATPGFSASTIRRRIQRFSADGGHAAHLQDRTAELRTAPDLVGRLLGMDYTRGLREITGIMVTRRPEPAAFVEGVQVPFAVIDQLGGILTGETVPNNGHVPF